MRMLVVYTQQAAAGDGHGRTQTLLVPRCTLRAGGSCYPPCSWEGGLPSWRPPTPGACWRSRRGARCGCGTWPRCGWRRRAPPHRCWRWRPPEVLAYLPVSCLTRATNSQ